MRCVPAGLGAEQGARTPPSETQRRARETPSGQRTIRTPAVPRGAAPTGPCPRGRDATAPPPRRQGRPRPRRKRRPAAPPAGRRAPSPCPAPLPPVRSPSGAPASRCPGESHPLCREALLKKWPGSHKSPAPPLLPPLVSQR